MDKRTFLKNHTVLKAAAAACAVALIAAASLIPAKPAPAQLSDPELLNPNPVVITLEEAPEAVVEEEAQEEEEKKQKLGLIARMKLAFYAFCAGAGAWIASRIPWGKIFNKRNLILVLVIAAIFLLMKYIGLPLLEDYMQTAQ